MYICDLSLRRLKKKREKKGKKHYILIWVQYMETLNMPNLQNGDDDDDDLWSTPE